MFTRPRIIAITGLLIVLGLTMFGFEGVSQGSVCVQADVCEGAAMIFQNAGGGNTRRTSICTTDQVCVDAPFSWEMDAGASITFFYRFTTTGALPPLAPNKVTIQIRYDDTGVNIRTFLNLGAEPANGASFEFFSTTDGTNVGAARVGTYRMYLRLVKDDAPGGIGNYDVDSDGAGAPTDRHAGALRGRVKIADAQILPPPAGSTYAFGPAGDETMTAKVTGTNRYSDNNVETVSVRLRRSSDGAIFGDGTTPEWVGSASGTRVCASDHLPIASYQADILIVGNAALTGIAWTTMAAAGHAAGIIIVSTVEAHGTPTQPCDHGMTFNTVSPEFSVYNRGETVSQSIIVHNARSEALTRSAVLTHLSDVGATENTQTDTGSPYAFTYTTVSTHRATADTSGSPKTVRFQPNTGVANGNIETSAGWSLSSLYRFDEDGVGTPDASVRTNFAVYNRGETVRGDWFIVGARGQVVSTQTHINVTSDVGANEHTAALLAPSANGHFFRNYTTITTHKATADTSGSPKTWTATRFGNSGTTGDTHALSSLYRFDTDGVAPIDGLVPTNFNVYNRVEDVRADYYVVNARDEPVTGTARFNVTDDAALVEDGQSLSDSQEHYFYNYTTGAAHKATKDTMGSPKTFTVAQFGNSGSSDDAHSVSRLYFIDAHPQKTATLVKDDFPTEDEAETFAYIISADILNYWFHVDGVRTDRDIDTSGMSISFELRRPNGQVEQSGTIDSGADGWTATTEFVPQAPAGQWTLNGTVSFDGNEGGDDEFLTFIGAFTENLKVRIIGNTTLLLDREYQFWLRTERNDAAIQPETLPQLKSSFATFGSPSTWADKHPFTNTRSGNDHQEAINGSLYYLNLTFDATGLYNVLAIATMNGSGIREQHLVEVRQPQETPGKADVFSVGTELGSTSTTNLLIILVMLLIGATLASRSDLFIRIIGAFVTLLAFLVALQYASSWAFGGIFALLVGLTGAYLMFRIGLDFVLSRKRRERSLHMREDDEP